jgi:mono/diheme cytochrome c family protein
MRKTSCLVLLILTLIGAIPLVIAAGQNAAPGDATAGKAVFMKNCNLCHYADKTDSKIGPGLKGLFKAKELPKSHHPVSEATAREQIEKGNPSKGMPPFGKKLSKVDVDNLIAYLKTL